MTEDLTARVTALTATIEEQLAEDEAIADRAARKRRGPWRVLGDQYRAMVHGNRGPDLPVADTPGTMVAAHIARNDPARVLQRVAATRSLVAAILKEPHDYNPSDEYYSCSQAVDLYEDDPAERYPGSGCGDPDRKGDPCDCGRDQRVARLLTIIASEWDEAQAG